jgi:microcin C transport system substrate-binding protein
MSLSPVTRREFVKLAGGAALSLPMAASVSLAANPTQTPLRGLSSFGELKYPAGYDRFDFARPDAPQGGTFAFGPSYWFFNQNVQTFNTLNSYVLSGEAPPRMELCFDKLMVWAWDEPDAYYCSLAETVTISADRNTYVFRLRQGARFTDGSPVSAADAAFSMILLKEKGHPQISLDMTNLDSASTPDAMTVELKFNGRQSDRAILSILSNVPILSKAYYEGRDFEAATLEPPLSSGPWRVGRFEAGRYIEYERDRNYWAADLPFARGLDHFEKLRIDFFLDRQAAFEAFKKGLVTWREEFTAKVWATEYNFPAIADGRVKQAYFESEKRPSLQGWAVNTRRQKFADARTREALATLFDFEWTNRNLFFGAYERSNSMFENSDLAASGLPTPEELALLEPIRDEIPAAALGEAVVQNVTNGTGRDRSIFRKADRLFADAGWMKEGGRLVDGNGEPLEIECLIRSPVFERILGPYAENMRAMGITASIRLVDPSQFQSRTEAFDFDMVGLAFSFDPNPTGESMRQYFHSQTAGRHGSYNYPGIRNAGIDRLVEQVDKAQNREELVTAMRALDRVLRAGYFWIPNWHSANHRVAFWDRYGWPEPKPDYFFPVERLWWFDAEKARAAGLPVTD